MSNRGGIQRKIEDPFYNEIDLRRIAEYQELFIKLLKDTALSDIEKWVEYHSHKTEYIDEGVPLRLSKAFSPLKKRAEDNGLNPAYVMVAHIQYALADRMEREHHKHQWISKVIFEVGDIRFFPSGYPCYKLITE